MTKIFYRYLIKRSVHFSFLTLIIFGLLDSVFMLISELENISNEYKFANIFKYVFFSMPHRLIDFVEGSCLLGLMISLGLSHQEGNLNVLRSSGSSPFKIVALSSLGAIFLTLSLISLDEISFRNAFLNAEASKNLIVNRNNTSNAQSKWVKSGDSYLNFHDVLDNKIYKVRFLKFKDKKLSHSIISDSAVLDGDKITFDNAVYKNFLDNTEIKEYVNFDIPLRSKITLDNINNLGIIDLYSYKKLFSNSTLKKDITFKSHIDKYFYKKLFLPISIFLLIVFFGSLVFTSLRESTIGGKIIISIVGAFIYRLIQDLSASVFISYNLPVVIGIALPSMILIILSLRFYKNI